MATNHYWTKLNLPKHCLDSLSLRCLLPSDKKTSEVFAGVLGEKKVFRSVSHYSREKILHVVFQAVDRGDPNEDDYILTVAYQVFPSNLRAPRKSLDRTTELLERLACIEAPSQVRWEIDFEFPRERGQNAMAAFPLPMEFQRSDIPGVPFDVIQGIRAAKFGPSGKVDYSFLLDRPENDDIYLLLRFETTERISAVSPAIGLAKAVDISNRLVFDSRR